MGLPEATPVRPREAVQRWRLVLARDALGPDTLQRDQQAAWEAALAGSGLPVAGLDAERPRARLAHAAPLPAGMAGEAELADTWLIERLPVWVVRESLVDRLPPGWRLRDLHDVWLGEPALPGQVVASVYRVALPAGAPGPDELAAAVRALLDADTLPRERAKGDRLVAYDLRPFIDGLDLLPPAPGSVDLVLRMTLRHDAERGVGRPDETLAAIADVVGREIVPDHVVRERLVLAEPVPRPEPPPRRRAGAPRPDSARRAR